MLKFEEMSKNYVLTGEDPNVFHRIDITEDFYESSLAGPHSEFNQSNNLTSIVNHTQVD